MTADEIYPLPDDFHGLIPDTTRSNSRELPVDVETSASTWSWLKTRSSNAGIQYRTRWFADRVQFHNPNPGDLIRFEYWSSNPITGVDQQTKPKFTADSDEWDLDDDLLTWELIWRFKKAKGLEEWVDDRAESLAYQAEYRGRQRPAKTLNFIQREPMTAGAPYTDQWLD